MKDKINFTFIISGLCGLCVGIFVYSGWQQAIEPAQVISGIVSYPLGSPVYVYSIKAWSIISQLLAVLLRLGFSEKVLSILLSGIIGMISYQALALSVLSLSRNVLFSIIVPFFINYTKLFCSRGITYPVWLMGSVSSTYGIIWLPYILLVIALISLKRYKLGGLLFGLAPAIHPSAGLWFTIVISLCFLWNRTKIRKMSKYILIGYLITAVSLFIQFRSLPIVSSAPEYMAAFVNHWDAHRFKFPLTSLWQVLPGLLISLVWIKRKDLPEDSIFLLKCCVISVVVGMFSVVYWLPNAPSILLTLMPSRIFNFTIAVFVILLLGLLWRYDNCQRIFLIFAISSYPKQACLLVLCALILLLRDKKIIGLVVSSAVIAFILRAILGLDPIPLARYLFVPALILSVFKSSYQVSTRKTVLVVLGISVILMGGRVIKGNSFPQDEAFFTEISKREGMLLTSSYMKHVQLRTRRPILLDGGSLDYLPYASEVGPKMNHILKQVYGVDIFNPPEDTWRSGGLSRESGKDLWESRTQEQWIILSRQFGFTDILTWSDWRLQLPVVIRNSNFILYSIHQNNR